MAASDSVIDRQLLCFACPLRQEARRRNERNALCSSSPVHGEQILEWILSLISPAPPFLYASDVCRTAALRPICSPN